MKLWTCEWYDEKEGPQTHWAATKEEVLHKAVEVGMAVKIKEVELPKGRAAMATWLNNEGVGCWK
jgi:hypothetical protein